MILFCLKIDVKSFESVIHNIQIVLNYSFLKGGEVSLLFLLIDITF